MDKYLNHFKIGFIIAAIVGIAAIGLYIASSMKVTPRDNDEWVSEQRVFDYADKLNDSDEKKLTALIKKCEKKAAADMAVIILDENLTSYVESYNMYVSNDEQVMVYADNFADENSLGWNYPHGDSVVFVDNWSRELDGNLYSWISTSGRLIETISSSRLSSIINNDLSSINDYATSAEVLAAYSHVVKDIAKAAGAGAEPYPWYVPFFAGLIIAVIYIIINWNSKVGSVTVSKDTYVTGAGPRILQQEDHFVRKTVTKTAIPKDDGSRGGGGGGHISSGGFSHGGGGGHR